MITEHEIVQSPAWFPLDVVPDQQAIRLLSLDETAYRGASFLDQRLLPHGYKQGSCALETVRSAAAKLPARAHYIFHTGHVGSTLISRLLGAHHRFFSLREPALLRTLTSGHPAAAISPDLDMALSLLSRTWHSSQHAVIKATSVVSELAERILGGAAQPLAIFMFAQPLAYLRGILAGPNSRVEARQLAPARRARLLRRVQAADAQLQPRSEGELIALNWLSEMTTLYQAAERFSSQVLWVDFDAFLAEPLQGLQRIFRAFGETPAQGDLEQLVRGPIMCQYSKAPEYAYDAKLRREVLLSADWEHSQQIRQGMDWLHAAVREHPSAAQVMSLGSRDP